MPLSGVPDLLSNGAQLWPIDCSASSAVVVQEPTACVASGAVIKEMICSGGGAPENPRFVVWIAA